MTIHERDIGDPDPRIVADLREVLARRRPAFPPRPEPLPAETTAEEAADAALALMRDLPPEVIEQVGNIIGRHGHMKGRGR